MSMCVCGRAELWPRRLTRLSEDAADSGAQRSNCLRCVRCARLIQGTTSHVSGAVVASEIAPCFRASR